MYRVMLLPLVWFFCFQVSESIAQTREGTTALVRQGGTVGAGQGEMASRFEDQDVFHFLLEHHGQIKRVVTELANGVETLTESEDEEVVSKLKEHVKQMEHRVKHGRPIRMRDPLFAALFKNADKIRMQHEETASGVRVTETSDDPFVVKLLQAHAMVVSEFVRQGHEEARKNHPVPPLVESHPVVSGFGSVVKFGEALHQPRDGSLIVVDVTKGSKPDEMNSALEKLAKYVNIYAMGGANPAKVKIAAVFHGDASLVVLENSAYKVRHEGADNPNTELLSRLDEAGVEMYVCAQSLDSKGATIQEVDSTVQPVVSALSAVVNLQQDGYAYIPLGN